MRRGYEMRLFQRIAMLLLVGILLFTTYHHAFQTHFTASSNDLIHVQLLGINDLHGQLDQYQQLQGKRVGEAEYLASHLQAYQEKNPHTLLVQAYSYGKAFSQVELGIDKRTEEIAYKQAEIVPVEHEYVKPDPKVMTFLQTYKDQLGTDAGKSIGTLPYQLTRKKNERAESPRRWRWLFKTYKYESFTERSAYSRCCSYAF